jgi:homogentisate 1,2-dioxygenase
MFETRWPIVTTGYAMDAQHRQLHYDEVWRTLTPRFGSP